MSILLSQTATSCHHKTDKMITVTHPYHFHTHKKLDLFVDTTPRFFTQPSSSTTHVAPWSASALFLPNFHPSAEDILSDLMQSSDEEYDERSIFSHVDATSEIASITRAWEMDNILDPTSVDADHEFDCLECLSAKIMDDDIHCNEDASWSEAADSQEDVTLVGNVFCPKDEGGFASELGKQLPPTLKPGNFENISTRNGSTHPFMTNRGTKRLSRSFESLPLPRIKFSAHQPAPIGHSPQPRPASPRGETRRKRGTRFSFFTSIISRRARSLTV